MSEQDVSRPLKDALFQTLTAILSPIQNVRINAENQITLLEVTDEFCVHLTELMLDGGAPLAVRQLASVLLKQYVESHWCCNSEKFKPPEATPEAKAAVRAMLPMGLQESISKLRSSVAYAISAVAVWDWPENWPELFNILLQSLVSENSFAVHGAMRVLIEISNDVSDSQMPQFAPVILPEMLKIFRQDQKYGIRTRGRAVEIFSTCVEMIGAMAPYNKSAPKNLLFPILTPFTESLVSGLQTPDGHTSDSGLKKDILNALKHLVRCFAKQMVPWMPHILEHVWNALTSSATIYISTVVNVSEEEDNPVDSDGEVLGFENFVFSIFDFILALTESNRYRNYIKEGMTNLLYFILLYTQITEEQIKTWSNNPDQFVEDEDDESFAYSVRISAQDLLLLLAQEFEDETAVSLCAAVTRHIHEADKNTNPHWWKIHESCMLALGGVKDLVVTGIRENNLQFDLPGFFHSVVLEDLNTAVSPFLYGRCLWFSSRYADMMNEDLIKRFLQATVNGLQPTQPSTVRVSAVRAVLGFCDHLKSTKQSVGLLSPFLGPMAEALISLAIQFSSEVLALALEGIANLISIDENFTAQLESKISPIAIAVFLKHNSDPILLTVAEEIFKQLSRTPGARAAMQQRLVPTLVSILQAPNNKVPLGLQAASLDILQAIVRSSPSPISPPLITQAFPAAVHCVLHADDNSILQNGGECLRGYVSVAMEQVSAWRDESGHSGLDYIFNVAQRLLDPRTPESASPFVGRLTSLLIKRAGVVIGDRSELLLRAVLSKMQQVEALSVNQLTSLLIKMSRDRRQGRAAPPSCVEQDAASGGPQCQPESASPFVGQLTSLLIKMSSDRRQGRAAPPSCVEQDAASGGPQCQPESASPFVGQLTSLLIKMSRDRRQGRAAPPSCVEQDAASGGPQCQPVVIGDRGELLLRAVLSKMQQVEALSVNQSLLLVFAHLINHQICPILDFLSGVPGPTGQPALEFVLNVWCQCHPLFYGAYEKKVSAYSLSLVLQHGLKENDQRLQNIQVRGDQIFNHTEGPRTRSKALQLPDQWTQIPLFVKIFKLLLQELANICNQGLESQEEEYESSDEDFVDGGDSAESSGLVESSSSGISFGGGFSDYELEQDEMEEDPDIVNDPVHSLQLRPYLRDYLQQLTQLPYFYGGFFEHLTPLEKTALKELGLAAHA
ncbi:hypothetical protein JTE90_017703 [Oedothorax gibbosus]|uniref:Importin N-terminal domain-containing protein n=1 Tax=Oedothorax gibbosus TaxID=931172 RepID=A0AAV6U780_9ARAC|nr:hypothetical protein JTE90_017703 [Oedothorax gibbosus]